MRKKGVGVELLVPDVYSIPLASPILPFIGFKEITVITHNLDNFILFEMQNGLSLAA